MQSRRFFLKNGAFALVSLGFAPSFLSRTALAAAGRSKQLIAIFQRGAVDGLSMVVFTPATPADARVVEALLSRGHLSA